MSTGHLAQEDLLVYSKCLKKQKIILVILHIHITYKIIFLERPVVKPNKTILKSLGLSTRKTARGTSYQDRRHVGCGLCNAGRSKHLLPQ